jgi:hypothetical protein
MRRGRLYLQQSDPQNVQPASALIVNCIQTEDLADTLGEFLARARGTSPSGIHWNYRSPGAALNRTTHTMRALTPWQTK